MKMFYSQSTGCTYLEGLHALIPEDAVAISQDRVLSVIGNPEPGKVRAHDDSGLPILSEPPADRLESAERSWRDAEIMHVQWLRDRHRDQLDLEQPPTLSTEQFSELLTYIRSLRDWPQSPEFPAIESRPKEPSWITDQTS